MCWYIKCAKKADLGSLKSDVDESGIGKWSNVSVDLIKLISVAKRWCW